MHGDFVTNYSNRKPLGVINGSETEYFRPNPQRLFLQQIVCERTVTQYIPPSTTSICCFSLIGLKSVPGTSFEVLPLHEAPAN
jgi:hypothetical protein